MKANRVMSAEQFRAELGGGATVSEGSYRLVLPFPPTVNHYWRQWRGRMLLSANGREYQKRVAAECLFQGVLAKLGGRLAVDIIANPPDRRQRDLDNLHKAILDGLAHAGVYENDEQIDDLRIRRGLVGKPGSVVVTVEIIAGGAAKGE